MARLRGDRRRAHASGVPSIRTLIRDHRDRTGASLRDLSRAASNLSERGVSHQRWADFEAGAFDQFPLPDTIRTVAATLAVDTTDVIFGFAVELGLPVRAVAPFPLPPGAETLDESQRRMIFQLVQSYLAKTPVTAPDAAALIAQHGPGVRERVTRRRSGRAAEDGKD